MTCRDCAWSGRTGGVVMETDTCRIVTVCRRPSPWEETDLDNPACPFPNFHAKPSGAELAVIGADAAFEEGPTLLPQQSEVFK